MRENLHDALLGGPGRFEPCQKRGKFGTLRVIGGPECVNIVALDVNSAQVAPASRTGPARSRGHRPSRLREQLIIGAGEKLISNRGHVHDLFSVGLLQVAGWKFGSIKGPMFGKEI